MQNNNAAESGLAYDPGVDPHKWVLLHADYLYSYAYTRINNEELAKDLVQETFLAALEKVTNFKGGSTERTWLTAILKNKVIDVYRKKSSGLALQPDIISAEREQQDFFEAADGHWDKAHHPRPFGVMHDDALNNREFAGVLQQCMQKLPALWLSVFTMKHMDDEPTESICDALKVTPSNFWVIIHRAKLNLRACLQKNWI